jgi:hypothetical protein
MNGTLRVWFSVAYGCARAGLGPSEVMAAIPMAMTAIACCLMFALLLYPDVSRTSLQSKKLSCEVQYPGISVPTCEQDFDTQLEWLHVDFLILCGNSMTSPPAGWRLTCTQWLRRPTPKPVGAGSTAVELNKNGLLVRQLLHLAA